MDHTLQEKGQCCFIDFPTSHLTRVEMKLTNIASKKQVRDVCTVSNFILILVTTEKEASVHH